MMSPEEIQPLFSPQVINIADPQLSDAEYPPLESLQRHSLTSQGVYLLYNGFAIYLYVGRMAE